MKLVNGHALTELKKLPDERDKKGRFLPGHHWRPRQKWWDKEWLNTQYKTKSASEIALENNTTESNMLYWLRKHRIQRRTVSEARQIKHWGLSGKNNPMWRGGITPRDTSSKKYREWRVSIFERDDYICQICNNRGGSLEAHHILPIRTFNGSPDLEFNKSNGITLCKKCHNIIQNKEMLFAKYLMKKNKEKE